VGVDEVTVAGIPELSVLATDQVDKLLALDSDVALYTAPREGYYEMLLLLDSGKNVITVARGSNTIDTLFHEATMAAREKEIVSFIRGGHHFRPGPRRPADGRVVHLRARRSCSCVCGWKSDRGRDDRTRDEGA
jgi:hypothetical protein